MEKHNNKNIVDEIMKDKLRNKHRLFVDNLFLNGFKRAEAYIKVYPDVNPKYASQRSYDLLNRPEVKAYFDAKMEDYRESMEMTKEKMIESKTKVHNLFLGYLQLYIKEDLTESEKAKLANLKELFGRVDINKVDDMINKLQGNYEAEKHQIEGNLGVNINIIKPEDKNEEDEDKD